MFHLRSSRFQVLPAIESLSRKHLVGEISGKHHQSSLHIKEHMLSWAKSLSPITDTEFFPLGRPNKSLGPKEVGSSAASKKPDLRRLPLAEVTPSRTSVPR